MSAAHQDRNLLFGIVALQFDFVTRDQLVAAMHAWVLDKKNSLADLLVERDALTASRRAMLEPLVEEHLRQHQGDPQRSLAALSSVDDARQALQEIKDPDLQASLRHLKAPQADVSPQDYATIDPPASAPTRFRKLRQHAKGGLGIVFIAHDQEVNRQVALKEIQSHAARDPDARQRFQLEAEITGGLEHPGIVPVYGLGHYEDGQPYYAMRFIKGDSLKEAVDAFHAADKPGRDAVERNLSLRQLLRRFIDVCNAIDYAHSKGVLHRDLKPGNIMLGKFGETLVVDWGLAKATGTNDPAVGKDLSEAPLMPTSGSGSAPTQMGSAIGTPAFMPPEQAAGRLDLLGPASDVYSLGATLYYVLTGKPPFENPDLVETLDGVQKGNIRHPRQVKPEVDAPLDAICLKAMAREIGGRYASAAALRKDVENWIADAPISARPDPASVKVRRWLVRHRVLAATAAATLVVASAFLGVLAYVTGQANEQLTDLVKKEGDARTIADQQTGIAKDRAEKLATSLAKVEAAEKKASEETRRLAITTGLLADGVWQSGKVEEALKFLPQIPKSLRGWDWKYRERQFQGSYATLYGHVNPVTAVAFSSDGERLASASTDGTVKVWDAQMGVEGATLRGHTTWVSSVVFSPDGQRLASGSADKTVKVWDARTGSEIVTLRGHTGTVTSIAFSPDGQRLSSASTDATVKVWNAQKGSEIFTFRGHTGSVESIAFSADSQRVASTSREMVKVWDARTGSEIVALNDDTPTLAFSPDGQRLATAFRRRLLLTGGPDDQVFLLDARTGVKAATLHGHSLAVKSVVFSPDGQRLASGSADKTVKVWDARTGSEIVTLRGHTGTVTSIAFSPDGQRLLTGSEDKTIKLWDARTQTQIRAVHTGALDLLTFSPDGKRLAGASENAVKMWNATTGAIIGLFGHTELVTSLEFSPDGQRLASGSADKTVKVWDARTGSEIATLRGHGRSVMSVAFSPDGQRLVSGSYDQLVKVWDARTGVDIGTLRGHTSAVRSVAFSPDGERLASAADNEEVKVWSVRIGKQVLNLRLDAERFKGLEFEVPPPISIAFSSDGQRLLCSTLEVSKAWEVVPTIKEWDARAGFEITGNVAPPAITTRSGQFTVFSPDGQLRASVSGSRYETVKLCDTRTGAEVITLTGHRNRVISMAFSPDGQRLASSSGDGTLVWDALTVNDVNSPSQEEQAFRTAISRFDSWWHSEQAKAAEKSSDPYCAAYHRGQLALHQPSVDEIWADFFRASDALGDDFLAFRTLDLAVTQSPDIAAVYRHRAQLRAKYFQTAEATADQIMALVLAARANQK